MILLDIPSQVGMVPESPGLKANSVGKIVKSTRNSVATVLVTVKMWRWHIRRATLIRNCGTVKSSLFSGLVIGVAWVVVRLTRCLWVFTASPAH